MVYRQGAEKNSSTRHLPWSFFCNSAFWRFRKGWIQYYEVLTKLPKHQRRVHNIPNGWLLMNIPKTSFMEHDVLRIMGSPGNASYIFYFRTNKLYSCNHMHFYMFSNIKKNTTQFSKVCGYPSKLECRRHISQFTFTLPVIKYTQYCITLWWKTILCISKTVHNNNGYKIRWVQYQTSRKYLQTNSLLF